MTWTTKSLGRDREYVVIKHRLNDINGMINGVKFRAGYGVVEKNSKAYFAIKQLPLIKGQPEYPITHLRGLKFITRTKDIQLVYGQDVYYYYLKQAQNVVGSVKETVKVINAKGEVKIESPKQEPVKDTDQQVLQDNVDEPTIPCAYKPKSGKPCGFEALSISPSGYCRMHLLKDPGLKALGIEVPETYGKSEVKELNQKVRKQLEELSNP